MIYDDNYCTQIERLNLKKIFFILGDTNYEIDMFNEWLCPTPLLNNLGLKSIHKAISTENKKKFKIVTTTANDELDEHDDDGDGDCDNKTTFFINIIGLKQLLFYSNCKISNLYKYWASVYATTTDDDEVEEKEAGKLLKPAKMTNLMNIDYDNIQYQRQHQFSSHMPPQLQLCAHFNKFNIWYERNQTFVDKYMSPGFVFLATNELMITRNRYKIGSSVETIDAAAATAKDDNFWFVFTFKTKKFKKIEQNLREKFKQYNVGGGGGDGNSWFKLTECNLVFLRNYCRALDLL